MTNLTISIIMSVKALVILGICCLLVAYLEAFNEAYTVKDNSLVSSHLGLTMILFKVGV